MAGQTVVADRSVLHGFIEALPRMAAIAELGLGAAENGRVIGTVGIVTA